MPEIDYGKSNAKVSKTDYNYPKLGGLKKDEKARILLIEKNPVFEWVHELKRPKIIEGHPVMVTKTRQNGEEYSAHDMDFLSRPICTGDMGVLDDEGIDVKGCLACQLAERNPEATKPPVRRFATHVLRYATKAGTTDVLLPFQAELLVWSFTERVFAQISEFKEEWGDLRAHDLLLTCTNGQFQNYDINVAKTAAYLEDDKRRAVIKEIYANQRIEDLSIACGRKTEERWIRSDIQKIEEAWAIVSGAVQASGKSLQEDLDALSGQEEKWAEKGPAEPEVSLPEAEPEAPAAASSADLDDMFPDEPKEVISDAEPEAAEEEPEVEAPKPAAKKAAPKAAAADVAVDDLDALLGV